jgi:hypothetical protein
MSDERFVFDPRFEEGFFHAAPPVLWGARLKPFSYWHKLQLERAQSKLLLGGVAEAWDIWVARQICRSQFPKIAKMPRNPNSVWYLWWKVCFGWRPTAKPLALLVEYVGDFASPPKMWAGKGSSKLRLAEAYAHLSRVTGDMGYMQKAAQAEADSQEQKPRDIDDSIEQVALYVAKSGRPPAESWNMPLGELVWYNVCFLKQEGADVPIWTPRDEEAFERNKIERYHRIAKLAETMRDEFQGVSEGIVMANAAVKYWEKVVQAQEAQVD